MIKLAKLNGKPEIFHSIQGEGKNIGKPSVFIRLSLCNLYCIWCDTDYTWNWVGTKFPHNNDKKTNYQKYSKDEFIIMLPTNEIVQLISTYKCNNLVITGGEPLLQHKELISLTSSLRQKNSLYHIEFETNGTIVPTLELDNLTDQYNVSVKLSNSKVSRNDRINDEALLFFSKSPKSNFKFVIDSRDDLEEVFNLMAEYNIDNTKVYLMPQGTTAASIKEKQLWLVEVCKANNFNYTDRIHIHIFGDKRGV